MGRYEEALDAFRCGEDQRARELSEEALRLAREAGDGAGQIDPLCMLARIALRHGEFAQVRALADEAMQCARAAGEPRLQRIPLHMQAVGARMSGDSAHTRALYEASIDLNRRLGEDRMVAAELHNLGYVELHDGRPQRAAELFREARAEAKRAGYDWLNPYLVGDLAAITAAGGDLRTAARLAGAAAAAFAAAGQLPDPDDAAEQQRLHDKLATEIGAEALQSLYAEGASLTPEQILDELGD